MFKSLLCCIFISLCLWVVSCPVANCSAPTLKERINADWLKTTARIILEAEGAIAIGGPSVETPWDGSPVNARVLQRVVRQMGNKGEIAESELRELLLSEVPFWRVVSYAVLSERRSGGNKFRYVLATACSRPPLAGELEELFP